MIILVCLLSGALVICILKISHDYLQVRSIQSQLKIVSLDYSLNVLKSDNKSKIQKELLISINQLLLDYRELHEKYERADRHNKIMVSSIAHDFRTPITSILGYVQMIESTSDPEVIRKYATIIERRLHSLNILIEDFYALSILESNEYPVMNKEILPARLLQNQVGLYYESLKQHFNHCQIDIPESSLPRCSDPHIMERIIANLLKNALSHGLDFIRISYHEEPASFLISIENGIAPEQKIDLGRLFERTYRADQSRHNESTGLGLSIAKQLGELIHCQLTAQLLEHSIVFQLHFKEVRP